MQRTHELKKCMTFKILALTGVPFFAVIKLNDSDKLLSLGYQKRYN